MRKDAGMQGMAPDTKGEVAVDPRYRRQFILKLCLGFVLIITVTATFLVLYLDRPFEGNYISAVLTMKSLSKEVYAGIFFSVFFQIIFFSGLIFLLSLLWTHRIAGPLYRLRCSFREVAGGNIALKTSFRKKDQLQNLPVLLNAGLTRLRLDTEKTGREVRDLNHELEALRQKCDPDTGPDPAAVRELVSRIRRLQDILEDNSA